MVTVMNADFDSRSISTMTKPKPSDVELQILGVLWEAGPLAVRDVLERMPDGKSRAYTSILSCLQVMEKKGLLSRLLGRSA